MSSRIKCGKFENDALFQCFACLGLSVGAKRRPRIDISSVGWIGKLKCFEIFVSPIELIS